MCVCVCVCVCERVCSLTLDLFFSKCGARTERARTSWCIDVARANDSGDMRLMMKTIDKDDYPCGGVRVLQDSR